MAKLVFLSEDKVVKEYVLEKTRVTIGRRASNDIHIDNLSVSGEHAVLISTADGIYIEDLHSTNGTVVNREKIKKQLLTDGDMLRVGKHKLKFSQDGIMDIPQLEGFKSTELIHGAPNPVKSQTMASAQTPAPDDVRKVMAAVANVRPPKVPKKEHRPRLQILSGQDAGSALLLDKAIVKIGRPNEQLALVTKRTQGYFLSHVLGEDYPLINGKPIDVHASELSNHDKIEVLGVKMELCLD